MTSDRDLLAFIRQHLPSVWALELLLLLRRGPDRSWSVEDIVGELRASHAVVPPVLDTFQRAGLVATDEAGRFRYAPAGPVVADLCDQIEQAYRERPVAVITAISAPPDRLQDLADAFKFRGDKI